MYDPFSLWLYIPVDAETLAPVEGGHYWPFILTTGKGITALPCECESATRQAHDQMLDRTWGTNSLAIKVPRPVTAGPFSHGLIIKMFTNP